MIRKLQKKLIRTIMTVLFLLIFLANLTVHLSVIHVCEQMTSRILQVLAESGEGLESVAHIQLDEGPMPGVLTISKEELFGIVTVPLYAAELTPSGNLRFFGDYRERTSLEPGPLADVLATIARRDTGSGRLGVFRYYKAGMDDGAFVVIADNSMGFERSVVLRMAGVTAAVSAPILLVLYLVSVALSRFALAPAEEAFRKQKQFISDAGHELKTPLSTITVNAAVLESELGANKYMDCIQSEAQRMDALVRQLLEVACVEDGGKRPQRERFSLSEIIYQATLPFESLAFERGIHYDARIQEDCFFAGEAELIRHVMSILLDNAFKYTPDGGDVSVGLQREGRHLVIQVHNTGVGISKTDLPHIFERFYRCDKARPGNGSYGLGLAIAQASVHACGGTLRAESAYGQWATFTVTL